MGIFFRGTILSGHMVYLLCGASILDHAGGLHKVWDSLNLLERLNREIRRRTSAVGIFPHPDAYIRLVTAYLMEYAEDWSVSGAYLCAKSLQDLLRLTA